MRLGIFGRKVGMTQIFDDAGMVVPITVVDTSDCFVTQIKTQSTDGYDAVQVGFGFRKPQNINKSSTGHFKKAGVQAKKRCRELRVEKGADLTQLKTGQRLSITMFEKGDYVDVIGYTKGLGNTGVMKRYGWKGKHATHGTSKYFRHGGSNGTNTFPGRVLKNKGMPGRKGNDHTTVPNILIVGVQPEQNLVLLRGAIPGKKNGVIELRSAKKKKAPTGRTMVASA